MTEKGVIARPADRSTSLQDMIQSMSSAPSVKGLVQRDELSAPVGVVERPSDESLQRRVAMALIDHGISAGPDQSHAVGSVGMALEQAGIPVDVYEQAVDQPGFDALYSDLHRKYVLIPQMPMVAQAVTTRARTGESGPVDRFMRLIGEKDDETLKMVARLEAQGGDAAVLEIIQHLMGNLEQAAREIKGGATLGNSLSAARAKVETRDDALDTSEAVDHSALFKAPTKKPTGSR